MRSIYNHRNRVAVEEDANVSRRLRDLEFSAISSYKKEDLRPVEPKDTVAVFTLTKYINDLEKNLTDLAIGLDAKLNQVVASISETPEGVIASPPVIEKGLYVPVRPVRGVRGAGITEQNTITRLVSSWNAFVSYLQSFKNLNTMSRTDLEELYTILEKLLPLIEKNINDILIIEKNDKTQKFIYEKAVLEALDTKIGDRNISKIELTQIAPTYESVERDINLLKEKADEYKVKYTALEAQKDALNKNLENEEEQLKQLMEDYAVWNTQQNSLYNREQRDIEDRDKEIRKAKEDNKKIELENEKNRQDALKYNAPIPIPKPKVPVPNDIIPTIAKPTKTNEPKKFSTSYPYIINLNDAKKEVERLQKEKEDLNKQDVAKEFKEVRQRIRGGEDFRQKIVKKEEIRDRQIAPTKVIHYHGDLNDFYKDDVN